jgi:hypothetical protein
MADVQIVCPTHGRAGEVTAFKTFGPELLLVVSTSQLPLYKEAYPFAKFDVHPDDIKGLGPKVKWMQARYEGGYFRVDDDAGPMIDHANSCDVTPETARAIVHRNADMAEQMGMFMFGFTELARPVYYSGHRPYRLAGELEGGDIWACGLNAYHHRKCLIDMRYAIPTPVGQKGGLARYRTSKRVWEKAAVLRQAFGEAIELQDQATFDDTYPWNLRVPWR